MSPTSPCVACGGPTARAQTVPIRGVPATLLRCTRCRVHFFPEPSWLAEVYAEPISELDIGLATRCVNHARIVEALMRAEGLRTGLDYGGGYGLLTRLLRDRGIDMRHYEPYTPNLFAAGFEGTPDAEYDAVSAVEVFEHLTDPHEVLSALSPAVGMLIVSTVLIPDGLTDFAGWWYTGGPTGQHITFYTPDGLRAIGERYGYRLTTDGTSVHVLHRRPLRPLTRAILREPRSSVLLARALRLAQRSGSLRESDGEAALRRYLAKAGRPEDAAP